MKLLIVGQDSSALDAGSPLANRLRSYGKLVTELSVIVPGGFEKKEISLSENVFVTGVCSGSKIVTFLNLFKEVVDKVKKDKDNDLILSTKDPYFLSQILIYVKNKYKKNFELQIHGIEKLNFFRKFLFRRSLKHASSIRVVSERLKNYLNKEFKVDKDRMVVVPIFSDWKKLQDLSKNTISNVLNKKEGQFVFLTIGRLVPVKRINLQIEAFAKNFRGNEGVRLVVIDRGPEKIRLVQLVNKLGISRQVEFIDHVDNVIPYIKEADCFLLTSESEGWGLVLIEALACYTPIITTDVGLVGEVIKPSLGVDVVVGEVEQIAMAMEDVFKNRRSKEDLVNSFKKMLESLPESLDIEKGYKQSWNMAQNNNIK